MDHFETAIAPDSKNFIPLFVGDGSIISDDIDKANILNAFFGDHAEINAYRC